MKPWQDLTITDDFMFCKVMSQPDLCKEMIELLLNIKIARIENIQIQKNMTPDYNSRGIRLDVYVQDSDRVFDIEMQTTDKRNIEKRTRYYQSLIDIDQLEKNMDYRKLKESFIIFICTFDPFGKGMPVYTTKTVFDEDMALKYDDKTNKVFYNLSAIDLKQKDSKLGIFLNYLNTSLANDEYTSKIEEAVKKAKYNLNWRKEYMTVGMWIDEEREKACAEGYATGMAAGMSAGLEKGLQQGIEQGIAQGIEQGMLQASIEKAIIAVKEFGVDIELVSEKYKVPLEDLKKAIL